MGLLGMEERAGHLGGTCAIDSKPGCGTIIRLQLPLTDHTA
jgi:signal transduction histidine kinase